MLVEILIVIFAQDTHIKVQPRGNDLAEMREPKYMEIIWMLLVLSYKLFRLP